MHITGFFHYKDLNLFISAESPSSWLKHNLLDVLQAESKVLWGEYVELFMKAHPDLPGDLAGRQSDQAKERVKEPSTVGA